MARAPLSVDPVDRFRDLVSIAAPPSLAPITSTEIAGVISPNDTHDQQVAKVASRLAERTPLTLDQAKTVVNSSLPANGTTEQKASSVSAAVSTATAGADIELSDPVMLSATARLWSAVAFFVLAAASILVTFGLAHRTKSSKAMPVAVSSATYVGIAIIAGLCIIAALVLVMGYKNVTIKGSGPSAKS